MSTGEFVLLTPRGGDAGITHYTYIHIYYNIRYILLLLYIIKLKIDASLLWWRPHAEDGNRAQG